MSDSKKTENLKKMSLIQLKEILHRENTLLKNNKLINNLADKGESIKGFRDKVEMEVKYREELKNIEKSMNKLSTCDNENEKHVQKLCEIEKTPEKERYKPFSTLNTIKEVKSDSKIFKIMEDCTHCNKPTKLILLPESIDILKKQDERVKEEQVRVRHKRILDKLQEYEEYESGSDSESEVCEHYPQPEELEEDG
ncbi:hypothetical protein NQ314_014253 [Rhamnusium bicolor]|uniref:Uncharacterized protein n=1 Tax=Rhamnusium bicolor TaxID=1586634 RepID=A0AAV8X3C7_9CUCU|nr:hypothetical protein NQ314_014253 [Rhamnusium bicolor]